MCSRGIFQLKYLQLFYCDYGGSSSLIRSLIPTLVDHPLLNRPKIDFRLYVRRNQHPFFKGIYINGYEKQIPLKGVSTEQEIIDSISLLRNSFGTQSLRHAGRKVTTLTPSIQGGWNESLFNRQNYPQHEMEVSRSYPQIEIPEARVIPVDKPIDAYRKTADPYQIFQKPKYGSKPGTNM